MILERYSNITGMILYDTKTILQWYSNSNSTILKVSRNVYQSRSIERWVHSGLPSISIVDPSSRSQLQNIVNDNCFTQLKHLSKSFELLEAYSNSSEFIYTATALWLSIQANLLIWSSLRSVDVHDHLKQGKLHQNQGPSVATSQQ